MSALVRCSDLANPLVKIIVRIVVAAGVAVVTGCQLQTVSAIQLEMHQALVNRTGLTAVGTVDPLRVSCAVPNQWEPLPLDQTVLYTHEQWRSPDHHVGMGVAYVHTPIPFSPQTLIWFAKAQYAGASDGTGKLLGQWTDTLGRCWFEAENARYHVRGYAMTRGNDAWMVYSGYRMGTSPPATEVLLADRGVESVAPLPASQ